MNWKDKSENINKLMVEHNLWHMVNSEYILGPIIFWALRILDLGLSYNTKLYCDMKLDNLSKVTETLVSWNMTPKF